MKAIQVGILLAFANIAIGALGVLLFTFPRVDFFVGVSVGFCTTWLGSQILPRALP